MAHNLKSFLFSFREKKQKPRHLSLNERCKESSLFRAKKQTRLGISSSRQELSAYCRGRNMSTLKGSSRDNIAIVGRGQDVSNDSTPFCLHFLGLSAPKTHLAERLCRSSYKSRVHMALAGVWRIWTDPRTEWESFIAERGLFEPDSSASRREFRSSQRKMSAKFSAEGSRPRGFCLLFDCKKKVVFVTFPEESKDFVLFIFSKRRGLLCP